MESIQIAVEAGDRTQDLIEYIFNNLEDDIVDGIEIDKVTDQKDDLAFEPLIIAGVLTLSTTTAVLVCRLLEKWMEQKAQERRLRILYEAARDGASLGVVQMLKELSAKYADVSIAAGVPSFPGSNTGKLTKTK